MKDQLAEACFLLPRKKSVNDWKFTNLSKCLNSRFIETLSGKDFQCSGGARQKHTQRRIFGRKIVENFSFPNVLYRRCSRIALPLHWKSFPLSVPMIRLFKHLDKFYGSFLSSNFDLCWAERSPDSVTASTWSIQAHAATWALIPRCHVPIPPTGEEDATMALTIWATSPMNMWIHKNAEIEC